MSIAAMSRPVSPSVQSHALDVCIAKIRSNIRSLADKPTTWALAIDGDYAAWNEGFYEIGNWTTSFFTGMAVIAFKQTCDRYFLEETTRL